MRSNYQRLGDFIEEINIRNRDLEVDLLLGVSIRKVLMPSIANTIGSDMSKYKIISKNQFAYGPITSRNGDKISIALLQDYEKALLSQAYKVFQIKDATQLLPEYLMMWFRRPEFDRYARYMSHGSTREAFDWQELCEVELPVPSLEKQQEIVADYNAVQDRIRINEQLNIALEETAQALYKHWFVDFQFPVKYANSSTITSSPLERTEERLGYKSSGGAMVYNEELDMEIPLGWEVVELGEVIEIKYGKDYKHLTEGKIPMYGSGGIMKYVNKHIYDKTSVLIPRKGSLSNIIYLNQPFWSVDTMFYSVFRIENIGHYIFHYLNRLDFYSLNVGSAVPSMTTKLLNSLSIIKPSDLILEKFNLLLEELFISCNNNIKENESLLETSNLLLSKMATVVDQETVKQ